MGVSSLSLFVILAVYVAVYVAVCVTEQQLGVDWFGLLSCARVAKVSRFARGLKSSMYQDGWRQNRSLRRPGDRIELKKLSVAACKDTSMQNRTRHAAVRVSFH